MKSSIRFVAVVISAAVLFPLFLGAQQPEIPLHHGNGKLVYSRERGWEHIQDTTGIVVYPRTYILDGGLGHGLKEITELDADSLIVRKWKISHTIGGMAVELESCGRSIYGIDSTGRVTSVRYETIEGEERPAPAALAAPEQPELRIRQDDVFVFDAAGALTGMTEGENGTLVYDPGFGSDRIIIGFADPVHDPVSVRRDTAIELVSGGDVRYSMKKVGAYDRKNHGLIRGMIYLKRQSAYYGLLDFARNGNHPLNPGTFYVAYTEKDGVLAHNTVNFGNFLWGAAAQAAGVPLWIARLGAHISNMIITKGVPDSKDDQLSIKAGYHFSKATGKKGPDNNSSFINLQKSKKR